MFKFDIRAGFSYHVTLESASGRRDVRQQAGGVQGL